MTKVILTEDHLEDIADAIRAKLDVGAQFKPSQMAAAIGQIHGEPVLETKSVTANGTYTPSTGKDGFSEVTVNVPNSYGAADEGKVVSNGELVAQTARASEITANGTYDTTTNDEVTVNVSGGGGSTNILSGTTDPTAAQGSNGDVYLKYTDKPQLPSGYTAVAYIEVGSTSGPKIDTGYNFTANSEFEIKAQYTNNPNSNSWLFGAYTSGKQTNVGFTNNVIYLQTGGHNVSKSFNTNEHVYKSTQSAFIIDGITQTSSTPNWSNTTTLTAKLFYINDGSYSNNCRVYYCKIWDNGTLVRNLVPCVRDSDDVVGLYDLANDVFYTNTGTGNFTAGSDATDAITAAYVKVSGAWQNLIGSDISDIGGVTA